MSSPVNAGHLYPYHVKRPLNLGGELSPDIRPAYQVPDRVKELMEQDLLSFISLLRELQCFLSMT
ncbi:hypothetical protein [Metallosphaera javensis (ex Sakai et al. 2022)]|uniref:hypothetical protein n=1 Tax=Metallosphaera javensis (ex Sakai et al. 2022) TaxID=2775498 RepID=UPI0025837716|nr:MAG: hypothetical protein MjAS7_2772 [Metallosphaera javensis (ex Sakai et al. 2022)]